MKIGQHQEVFLAGLLVALGAGIGCASLLTLPMGIVLSLLVMALLLSVYGCCRAQTWTWLAFVLAFFFVGFLRFMAADNLSDTDISHFAKETVKIEGTLREVPRLTEDNQGRKKQRYLLDVTKVKQQGKEWQMASGGLYVYAAEQAAPEVRIGDKVTATGKVRSPHGYQNPGQLDTKMLLKSQGISASLSAGKQGIKVMPVDMATFARKLAEVRRHYRDSMEQVMPKSDAAAIFAMLFGGYDGLKPELVDSFTITGIVHILSVSGSHISLLAAVMAGLLYLAPVWQKYFREHGCNAYIAAGLSITLAAQLATLPILAWYFNQLSLSSLIANLVVVPLVEIIIVLGLFAGVVAFILPFAGSVVFACGSLLLGVVTEITVKIAALPASAIWIPSMNFGWGLLYYLLLGLFLLNTQQREQLWDGIKKRRNALSVALLVVVVFLVSVQLAKPKEMQVYFIDVCR